MLSRILFSILFLFIQFSVQAQIFVELRTPQGVDPCQGLPVEVRVINEGNKPVTGATLQFKKGTHLTYRPGSLSAGTVRPRNLTDPAGPVFSLDFLDICESLSFSFWMEHGCASQSHSDSFEMKLMWNGLELSSGIRHAQIFSPKISIINLGLVYDEASSAFRKRYSIVNIGQVALDSFSLFVSGNDKMTILNTNYGTLSANGDTLTFNSGDFSLIGNGNDFFERGEIIDIVQEVSLNACETDFRISHRLRLPCARNVCEFTVDDNVKLQAIVGTPKLGVLQDTQITATPCRDGEVNLRFFNTSNNGNFNLGNSLYNLYLDLGWAVIQGNQYTEPRIDNCLRIKEVRLNGRIFTVSFTGFTGYGLDFRRLTTDPDGPGGLRDLDRDGFFDDLGPTDTLKLYIKYEMDPNCLRMGCDQVVFDWRILRIKGEFINYCGVVGNTDGYYSNHSYQWGRPSIYTGGIKGVYVDQETDTVTFQVYKNERNILGHCDKDSSAVRIILPPVADLLPGAVILVNGSPVAYRRNSNVIYFDTDTSNFIVTLPLRFKCDPNSGSGGVNTACTYCVGSGGPRYSLRIEVDYFCGDRCFQRIPLYCGSSPAFAAVCNPNGGGQNSPGKLVIEDMKFKRLTTGYKDSTKQIKVNPDIDSINHNYFFTYDTFLIYIPVNILCNASFSNIFFRLAYSPRLYYNSANQVDTVRDIQWLSDTLKYFDGETNRWSVCRNPLGPEYYSLNTNNFYRNFLRELDLSALFGTCLNGSLSTRDSMVFVIRAAIPPSEISQWAKTTLTAELTYNQDGCNMRERKSGILNIFSGKPSAGNTTLRQEYHSAPDLTRISPYLSVCGDFRIETSLDAYGIYAEDPDPFKNEYRNTYLIDELKLVIPPFFQYQGNAPNYVRITRAGPTGGLQYDTTYIPPNVRDSAGYTILEFGGFNDKEDFELVQHSFFFYLRPECYVTHSDTVRVFKKFKYLRHLQDASMHKDLYSSVKIAVNTVGVDAGFSQLQKQILRDTIVSWAFDLSSKNKTSTPQRFFTYRNLWMFFANSSGQILIDSLVEYDSLGNRLLHQPRILGPRKWVYELDSLYGDRRLELFTRFNSCGKDSLVVMSGNSCASYPADYESLTGKCRDYAQRQVLYYEPEESSVRLELLAQPDDSLSQPCDSFLYRVQVYNSGLGHSFNNRFYFTAPPGLVLREAMLEYPKDSFWLLPAPSPSAQPGTYFWELNPVLFPTGIPGFYRVDENHFKVHFKFDGNCDLEDGQSVSFYVLSSNVCNQQQRSQVVSSDPFKFSRTNQNQQDLYDIHLSFSADSACGEVFRARCVLYSKNDSINRLKQKLYFIYAKELSFIPGSFRAISHVDGSAARFYYLDGLESVEAPLTGPILRGDSAVFELELERTCIELCKSTDFKLLLNSEQSVGCAGSSGGVCSQLLQVQEWSFDNVELSPRITIEDSELSSSILPGGFERLKTRYLIENKSPFAGKVDYRVDFYYDLNGDGKLDSSDILSVTDRISGASVDGFSKNWYEWTHNVPGVHSCRLIAVVRPEDNPCLCTGDTLLLNPALISGESKRHRICYDQDLKVGFDSVSGYNYLWLHPDRLDTVDRHEAIYRYPFKLQEGSEVKDTLMLFVSKAQNCSFYDTVFVEIYRPGADVLQTDSIRCHGDLSAALRAEGAGSAGPWNFEWQGRTETSQNIRGLGPGWYYVKVSDNQGCAAYDSIQVSEPPPLGSKLSVVTDYNGFSVSCHGARDGAVRVQVQGGTPGYQFLWSKGQAADSLGGLGSGWIKVQVLDKNLCPAEDSVLLNEPLPLQIKGNSYPAGCDDLTGGAAAVQVSGGVPSYSLLWSNGAQADSLWNLKSGKYRVEATDANGCKTGAEFLVDQLPDPLVSASISDTTVEFGSSIRLSAWTNAASPRYRWSPAGDLSCDSCASVMISPTTDQTIYLTVTDENGCTAEASFNIRVAIIKDVWAPNVFSPNADQVNDRFTIYGKPTLISIDKLQIYDRWGELLYEDHDLPPNDPNFGWDGYFRGTLLNPGVFVYVAQVRFVDGETRLLYGDVTLIR